MSRRYFGNWTGVEGIREDFADSREWWNNRERLHEPKLVGAPEIKDEEVLLAIYDTPGYEGHAFVLFERDGKLFEVHGGHCSCCGLEGQWEPEETSWAAIAMRPDHDIDYAVREDREALAALRDLVTQHVYADATGAR